MQRLCWLLTTFLLAPLNAGHPLRDGSQSDLVNQTPFSNASRTNVRLPSVRSTQLVAAAAAGVPVNPDVLAFLNIIDETTLTGEFGKGRWATLQFARTQVAEPGFRVELTEVDTSTPSKKSFNARVVDLKGNVVATTIVDACPSGRPPTLSRAVEFLKAIVGGFPDGTRLGPQCGNYVIWSPSGPPGEEDIKNFLFALDLEKLDGFYARQDWAEVSPHYSFRDEFRYRIQAHARDDGVFEARLIENNDRGREIKRVQVAICEGGKAPGIARAVQEFRSRYGLPRLPLPPPTDFCSTDGDLDRNFDIDGQKAYLQAVSYSMSSLQGQYARASREHNVWNDISVAGIVGGTKYRIQIQVLKDEIFRVRLVDYQNSWRREATVGTCRKPGYGPSLDRAIYRLMDAYGMRVPDDVPRGLDWGRDACSMKLKE